MAAAPRPPAVDMLRDWRRLERCYRLEDLGVVLAIELSNEAMRGVRSRGWPVLA
ncbi:MAG: hypothetical protein ACRDRG_08995 [Pseudonocardiaceae bacterium]